jgi:predicted anti-sigma-YlaC factor YlaD
MRANTCSHEHRIVRAAASGQAPDPDVQTHLASCETCRDAVAVSRWMNAMAPTAGEFRSLPSPELLWWKAQLLRRWEAERRVTAPIERTQRVELLAAIAGVVGLVVWQWDHLVRAFGSLNPANVSTWTNSAGAAPSLPVIVLGAVLFGALVVGGIHRLINES